MVPPNDPRQLADALEALLCDDDARSKLGQEGARKVHGEYNAATMAAKTWEVLERFILSGEQ